MTKLQLHRQKARAATARYRAKMVPHWLAAGLTTKGKPRQRRRHSDLDHLHGEARNKARYQKYRDENFSRGMTAKGNAVRRLRRWPQLAHLHFEQRDLARQRIIYSERRAAGFTSLGGIRKQFRQDASGRSLKQISWEFFRSTLNSQPLTLNP